MTRTHPIVPRRRQRGLSLAEILVAMTVFVIAMVLALLLYDQLSQSYKRGDNAVDVQQNTRLAFDRMVGDLLATGYNYNPDGSTSRPDEQIEGAWETAVTMRADFDVSDATLSQDPEATLAGGTEVIVSTGNDEIVTYALGKPGATTGDSLSFLADVQGVPRDGTTETVSIANLALVEDDPPYTLYRFTVLPNSTAVSRTPVADNIYALRFRYLDSADADVGPSTPDDFSDDIGGAETATAREMRDNIARIEVTVVGLTRDPDLEYVDPTDPYPATRHHRKFTLAQDVTPRNHGFIGRPDIDTIPPSQPTNLAACPGHCQSMLLTWDPPDAAELVRQWVTVQGTSPTFLGTPKTFTSGPALVGDLTDGESYYFRIRSEDTSGNISEQSELATPTPATVADATTPEQVGLFSVSGGGSGPAAEDDHIRVGWGSVTTNVETLSCDPEPTKIRDLKGYRLYRSESVATVGSSIYLGPDWLTADKVEYLDTNVVACRTYYYDITAVDQCGNEGAAQASIAEGTATTQQLPAQVTGLQAEPDGADQMLLEWNRVASNTNGDPTLVDHYRIYRAELPAGLLPAQAEAAIDWQVSATQFDVAVANITLPQYTDNVLGLPSDPANSLYYRVSALNDCNAPNDEGALSMPNEGVICDLGGTISLTPADGASVTGIVTVGLDATPFDPSETFSGFVVITNASGATVESFGSGLAPVPLPISESWDTSGLPPDTYTLTATVVNSAGCSETVSQTVSVLSPSTCCIAPQSPVLGPQTGKLSKRKSALLFNLVNNCGQNLEITSMDVSWTDNIGTHHLENFCYDVPANVEPESCTPYLSFVPPQISPASHDFSPVLPFGSMRDSADPVIVGYQYDLALATTDPEIGETITVDLFYQLTGVPSPAHCTVLVHTNPLEVSTPEE